METKTFEVLKSRLGMVTDRLDALIRKAEKLGVAPIQYSVGPEFARPNTREMPNGTKKTIHQACHVVSVTGETPKFAGWEFVATLEPVGDKNLLKSSPFFKGTIPERFRSAESKCDHCEVIRKRNETHVVRNLESGDWKQVGSSCIKDFLGGVTPESILFRGQFELSSIADDEEKSFSEGGGRDDPIFKLESVLAITSAVVRQVGWCSKGKAKIDESLTPTAEYVSTVVCPPCYRGMTESQIAELDAFIAKYTPTERDVKEAKEAIAFTTEFLKGQTGLSDYEYNLSVLLESEWVDGKNLGLACSITPFFIREVEKKELKEQELSVQKDSVYVGQPKDRMDFEVRLLKVFGFEGQYGEGKVIKLMTKEGNIVTWITTSAGDEFSFEKGVWYRIKATVKKHNEYQGIKETQITRAKFLGEVKA